MKRLTIYSLMLFLVAVSPIIIENGLANQGSVQQHESIQKSFLNNYASQMQRTFEQSIQQRAFSPLRRLNYPIRNLQQTEIKPQAKSIPNPTQIDQDLFQQDQEKSQIISIESDSKKKKLAKKQINSATEGIIKNVENGVLRQQKQSNTQQIKQVEPNPSEKTDADSPHQSDTQADIKPKQKEIIANIKPTQKETIQKNQDSLIVQNIKNQNSKNGDEKALDKTSDIKQSVENTQSQTLSEIKKGNPPPQTNQQQTHASQLTDQKTHRSQSKENQQPNTVEDNNISDQPTTPNLQFAERQNNQEQINQVQITKNQSQTDDENPTSNPQIQTEKSLNSSEQPKQPPQSQENDKGANQQSDNSKDKLNGGEDWNVVNRGESLQHQIDRNTNENTNENKEPIQQNQNPQIQQSVEENSAESQRYQKMISQGVKQDQEHNDQIKVNTNKVQTHFVTSSNSQDTHNQPGLYDNIKNQENGDIANSLINQQEDNQDQQFEKLPIYEHDSMDKFNTEELDQGKNPFENQLQNQKVQQKELDHKSQRSNQPKGINVQKQSQKMTESWLLFQRLEKMQQKLKEITNKPGGNEIKAIDSGKGNEENRQSGIRPDDNLKLQNMESQLEQMETKLNDLQQKIKSETIKPNVDGFQTQSTNNQSPNDHNLQQVKDLKANIAQLDLRISQNDQKLGSISYLQDRINSLQNILQLQTKRIDQISKPSLNQMVSRQQFNMLNIKFDQLHSILETLQKQSLQNTQRLQEHSNNSQLVHQKTNQNHQNQTKSQSQQLPTNQSRQPTQNPQASHQNKSQVQPIQNNKTQAIKENLSKDTKTLNTQGKQFKNESVSKPDLNQQNSQSEPQKKQKITGNLQKIQQQQQEKQTSSEQQKKQKKDLIKEQFKPEQDQEEQKNAKKQKSISMNKKSQTNTETSSHFDFSISQIIFYIGLTFATLFLCNMFFFKKSPRQSQTRTKQYNPNDAPTIKYNNDQNDNPNNRSIEKLSSRPPIDIDNTIEDQIVSDRRFYKEAQEKTTIDDGFSSFQSANKSQVGKNRSSTEQNVQRETWLSWQKNAKEQPVVSSTSNEEQRRPIFGTNNLSEVNKARQSVLNSPKQTKVQGNLLQQKKSIRPLKKPTNQSSLQRFQKVRVPDAFNQLITSNSNSFNEQQNSPTLNNSVGLYTVDMKAGEDEEFEEYSDGTNNVASQPIIDTSILRMAENLQQFKQLQTNNQSIIFDINSPIGASAPIISDHKVLSGSLTLAQRPQNQQEEFQAFQQSQTQQIPQHAVKKQDQHDDQFIQGEIITISQNDGQPQITESSEETTLDISNNNFLQSKPSLNQPIIQVSTNIQINTNQQSQEDDPFKDIM